MNMAINEIGKIGKGRKPHSARPTHPILVAYVEQKKRFFGFSSGKFSSVAPSRADLLRLFVSNVHLFQLESKPSDRVLFDLPRTRVHNSPVRRRPL
jgi:hypothetical protein